MNECECFDIVPLLLACCFAGFISKQRPIITMSRLCQLLFFSRFIIHRFWASSTKRNKTNRVICFALMCFVSIQLNCHTFFFCCKLAFHWRDSMQSHNWRSFSSYSQPANGKFKGCSNRIHLQSCKFNEAPETDDRNTIGRSNRPQNCTARPKTTENKIENKFRKQL